MKNPLTWLTPLLFCASVASAADVVPRPGLWSLQVEMGQGDIPQLDPELLREFGFGDLQLPSAPPPRRYEICLTPEQVERETFPDLHDDATGCTATNLRRNGDRIDGELSCDGWMQGSGRVRISLLDAQRYTGQASFQGSSQEGLPLSMTGSLDGRWLSPDCGTVAPL